MVGITVGVNFAQGLFRVVILVKSVGRGGG